MRTTTIESSPIEYSMNEPAAGSSSSRPAICHTRGHRRVELEVGELGGGVALLGHEAVRAHEEVIEAAHARIGL